MKLNMLTIKNIVKPEITRYTSEYREAANSTIIYSAFFLIRFFYPQRVVELGFIGSTHKKRTSYSYEKVLID